jgi:hypothetical protein
VNDVSGLTERMLAELRIQPPGTPVPAGSLAERLDCALEDVLAAGEELQQREQGDEDLVAVVRRISDGGDEEFYLSRVPLTLNDEPETR